MENRGILTPDHPLWPKQLQDMEKPPKLLYYWGDLDVLNLERVAVIGSRHPTPKAVQITKNIVQTYNVEKKAIVSGFAYGIDITAHLSADKTIVVLSTRLERNEIYPPEHRIYIDHILSKGGLFISEYDDSLIGQQYRLIQQKRLIARDYIVANIVDIIVPVQFRKNSGTEHTVNAGIVSNRSFNIPILTTKDREDEGNRELIRELGLPPFKIAQQDKNG